MTKVYTISIDLEKQIEVSEASIPYLRNLQTKIGKTDEFTDACESCEVRR